MAILIIKIILTAIFTLSVIAKLTGKTKSTFEDAGYSLTIMYATAFAEIFLTAALYTRFELYAIVGLLAILGGAIFTLIRQKAKTSKFALALISFGLLLGMFVLTVSK